MQHQQFAGVFAVDPLCSAEALPCVSVPSHRVPRYHPSQNDVMCLSPHLQHLYLRGFDVRINAQPVPAQRHCTSAGLQSFARHSLDGGNPSMESKRKAELPNTTQQAQQEGAGTVQTDSERLKAARAAAMNGEV